MAHLQTALLANAASQETSGLVSMLGAFVDTVSAPAVPIRAMVWLVARFWIEDTDFEHEHAFLLTVETINGGQELMRLEGGAPPFQHDPTVDPFPPPAFMLILPVAVEFSEPGNYMVRLRFDGEQVWEGPLRALLLWS